MLRHISTLLLSVLLMLALAASVALAAPPEGKGVPGADEEPITGKPNEPRAWGAVTSQTASNIDDPFDCPGSCFGQHASDPLPDADTDPPLDRETPRLGIGNVARNDEEQAARLGSTHNPTGEGTHVSDHGCVVDQAFGADCTEPPGPSS